MNQQITILVVVDVEAALTQDSLENNLYLIDNLKNDGSKGIGSNNLTTIINGTHWLDKSQASEVIINWQPISIASLPSTLGNSYHKHHSSIQLTNCIGEIDKLVSHEKIKKSAIRDKIDSIPQVYYIEGKGGNLIATNIKVLDIIGNPLKEKKDVPSYNPPQINNITGEAVSREVIFPAQYGSPISMKDGFYWSASVDTSKEGIHSYSMQITLYDTIIKQGKFILVPKFFEFNANLQISTHPMVNGFTKGALSYLPII